MGCVDYLMKKIIIIVCLVVFLLIILSIKGCTNREKAAITIDKISITKDEFERALAAASLMPADNEFRKDFLEKFIARKLILYDAERTDLDKDPEFLNEVQQLWEQALLNLALSRKIREFSIDTHVRDREIKAYYQQNKKVKFIDKELAQVYDQIKWSLLNEKQRSAIGEWADNLKQSVAIKIDYEILGIEVK